MYTYRCVYIYIYIYIVRPVEVRRGHELELVSAPEVDGLLVLVYLYSTLVYFMLVYYSLVLVYISLSYVILL